MAAYEMSGPNNQEVRDNYFKKYYTWKPPIYGFKSYKMKKAIKNHIPDGTTGFGSYRGYATFGEGGAKRPDGTRISKKEMYDIESKLHSIYDNAKNKEKNSAAKAIGRAALKKLGRMAEPGGSSYLAAMKRFEERQGASKNNNQGGGRRTKKYKTRRKGGFIGLFKKKIGTKKHNNKNYNNMNLTALEAEHKQHLNKFHNYY